MSDVDLYLKSLEDRGKDISRRESSLVKQEETIRAQRVQLEKDRAAWEAASTHYREFLKSQGKQSHSIAVNENTNEKETTDFSTLNLRVGPKRKAILAFIAKQSKAGRKVTTREITDETGQDSTIVSNVVWSDRKREFLDRDGDRIFMTHKGFEFVVQAGVYS
jgi:hypothetical protein